jgi:hypothetical protein
MSGTLKRFSSPCPSPFGSSWLYYPLSLRGPITDKFTNLKIERRFGIRLCSIRQRPYWSAHFCAFYAYCLHVSLRHSIESFSTRPTPAQCRNNSLPCKWSMSSPQQMVVSRFAALHPPEQTYNCSQKLRLRFPSTTPINIADCAYRRSAF